MTGMSFDELVASIDTIGDKRPVRPRIAFDRWAICDAYYWHAVQYHNGMGCKWYAVLGRLEKIGFRPTTAVQHGRLDATAMRVFHRLVSQR